MRGWATKSGVLIGAILLSASGAASDGDRRDAGFYLVVAEADNAKQLPSPTSDQQVVRYDYKFLRQSEREATRYLLLPK